MPEPTFWNDLLKASLTVVSLVMTGFAIPWLRAHVGEKRLAFAERAASNAVQAAEQMGGASGAQKFENAKERARDLMGGRLTDEQWRTLIESTVNDVKRWGQEIKAPAPVAEEL